MTTEEAVKELSVEYLGDSEKTKEAKRIAIKALEQQPCEDCISRESTVKRLCKVGDFMNEKRSGLGSPYIMAALFIQDNKDEFPSVTPKAEQKWIPCTERLPKDGDTYLVTIEYNGKVIGVDAASYSPVEGYIDKHWDTFNDWKEDEDSCYHVTAWMPLPEPYMAESEE